jgi:response regulator RpfG family c-di-GMP phosphodiesterase
LPAADGHRAPASGRWGGAASAKEWLQQLVRCGLLSAEAVQSFLQFHADRLAEFGTVERLGRAVVSAGLLTSFQLQRVLSNHAHGLVLGNYRLLEKLGGGSAGTVYLGEHTHLKRRVAIKVMETCEDFPASVLDRFFSEMKVLAQLSHPHIVTAYDAGVLQPVEKDGSVLHYLAMELLDGDLENYVYDHGTLPVAQACEWMRQAAAGLVQAHDHHLIHRDLKPSNILRNEQNQIKLVDFGLARVFSSSRTEPRCLLGSIEFMAPEQSIDPSQAREPADVYGLGATLFWMLTGHTPYPREDSVADALRRLQTEQPRRLRELLPDVPKDLDELVWKMLARKPDERPESARVVMQGLARHAAPMAAHWEVETRGEALPLQVAGIPAEKPAHVLIVDDEENYRRLVRGCLEPTGCVCYEAEEALSAMDIINEKPIDLVLLDLHLPNIHGYDVCKALRAHPPRAYLKILITSGMAGPTELGAALEHGADDFIPKPVALTQLTAQVHHALRMKEAQDRLDQLARHMMTVNKQLEHSLQTRNSDVRRAEDALLFAMAKMAETRETGISNHLRRLQKFVVCLGERLSQEAGWTEIADRKFIENLERCIPLHDIGKIALPDGLVQKQSALTDDERRAMESHTTIGASLIDAIAQSYGQSLEFLGVARAIVRHHHERYDGRGYPDKLVGEDIPAAARVATLADVYDSLRRQRPHRQPLTHAQTARLILQESPGLFDPAVQRAFSACQEQFQQIYDSIGD